MLNSNITIQTTEMPQSEFKALVRYFLASRNYEYIRKDHKWDIITNAAKLAPSFNEAQILSVRNSVMKDKVINRYNLIQAIVHRVADKYANGQNIVELSEEHDFPPIHLLRAILIYRGEDLRKLTGRDSEQWELAMQSDLSATNCELLTAARAATTEKYFVDWIKSLGLKCKDQNDLVSEQIAKEGRAMSTPDILFDNIVKINNICVRWIDFKNYVGSPINFLRKSNKRQAAKYTVLYGPGAIAFGKGVIEGYAIPGTYALDVSSVMANFTDDSI